VTDRPEPYDPVLMKAIRNAALALSLAAVIAGIVRIRGTGGVPPQRGGWRELPIDEVEGR
jgi:hypothetical protein